MSLIRGNASFCNPDGHITCAEQYFSDLVQAARGISREQVDEIAGVLFHAYRDERSVFTFGNGGSAALASHFACDLGKGTAVAGESRKRLRVWALTDNVPLMTAWANDTAYGEIFAEQLRNLLRPGDVCFAISGSGNSPNVLNALHLSREMGAINLGLAGYQGGKMKLLCDLCLVVPSENMQIIEDLHLSVAHSIFTTVRHCISQAASPAVAASAAAAP